MEPAIIDRGRGPEIAGSRITVYDVLAETATGATPEELAHWYQLDVFQNPLRPGLHRQPQGGGAAHV